MKSLQATTSIIINIASLLTIITIATNYWLVEGENAAGLFVCSGTVCGTGAFRPSSVVVAVLFIASLIEMLTGSIILFVAWNKSKLFLQKVGTALVMLATLQYFIGCGVFTLFTAPTYPKLSHWGLSYAMAWGVTILSFLSSVLCLRLLSKTKEETSQDITKPRHDSSEDSVAMERSGSFV